MSNMTHCDNPGCSARKDGDVDVRRMCDEPRMRLYPDRGRNYDFCSRKCLAEWAAVQP